MFDPKEFCPKTFCNHTGMWKKCFQTLNLLLKQERTDGMNLILRSMGSFRTLFQVVASRPVGMMSNTENVEASARRGEDEVFCIGRIRALVKSIVVTDEFGENLNNYWHWHMTLIPFYANTRQTTHPVWVFFVVSLLGKCEKTVQRCDHEL